MSLGQRLAIIYIRTKFRILSALNPKKAARAAFQLFCTPQTRNIKELPPIFKTANPLSFPFKNNRLTGYHWNPSGRDKLLILHGFESSVINFDRYITPLINLGYEIFAFDAPAHGRSEGKTINALIYRDMIKAILQTYGPIRNFIAHSFGGLSLSLALEDEIHDESTRVVFIAPAVETSRAVNNFFTYLQLPKKIRKPFEEVIREAGNQPAEWYSLNRAASRIRASVLFVQDKQDELTPYADVVPIMKKNLPNFQFLISDGLGHSRIYRDEKVAASIVNFFDRA